MLRPSYTLTALGTNWLIETDIELTQKLKQVICTSLDDFDSIYSRFRDESLVRQLAREVGVFEFPDSAIDIIPFYKKLYEISGGRVTPLIGRVLEQAGYDKEYSLKPQSLEVTPDWDDVMKWQGTTVTTSRPIVLDIGAAGKGYAVDMIGKVLENNNIKNYVIDASGDIRHRGDDEQQVGFENPNNSTEVIGKVVLQNASLCASASNRRQWGDWHHIIDPTRNQPVREIVATWVIAETTMIADGLATALFFVPAKELLSNWQFQYVQMYANGTVEYSQDLKGELFT
ncbi:MAG: FAD:protein FMN transferase [Candidatus Saccharimonadales bacterium]